MDITQLKYFKAIEEERSFTRAAKKIGVTQPALSHQIRNLEHELGGPVLERSGRTVTLTPLGDVLLPHARALIAQLDQARNETLAHVNAQTGTLRIGTTQSFNAVYLREIIAAFSRAYPNTTFNVQELLVPEMEDQLLEGSLDLGFSYFPAKHSGIEETVLYDEALVAAAPRGLVRDSPITFAALCAYPMALPTPNTQTRRIIDEHARQTGSTLKERLIYRFGCADFHAIGL
ncbi:LysR substrate-binding domain-containing protein [Salipiger sp. P9]|uniref:LysR family transcriptional regulator n=1 Tax=Salipiger pentaromativorans TaxID=2943193 RepID=UPI0021571381|nr:LysR substrate-binding domain-containing protein [Salipiger pentaromativorans]MCR8551011.1 LysR substrate-binding domain-containing protein [Salipiger pentaromativorans]